MQIMEMMNEEYPGKFSMSKSRIKIWTQMLSDLDSEPILAAGYHLVSTGGEWPPAIGTVRLIAKRLTIGELHPQTAMEAWENVQLKIQHKDVELSWQEKKALSRVGSIYDLRRSEKQSFDRANFIKSFEDVIKTEEQELVTMPNVAALVASASAELPKLESAGKSKSDVAEITASLKKEMGEI